MSRLEKLITKTFTDSGGKINGGRHCQVALYDEQKLGFWLDILHLIETVQNILYREKSDLYGYALLIGRNFQEKPEDLCRFLALGPHEGGVFLDREAKSALSAYLDFERIDTWSPHSQNRWKADVETLSMVKNFKSFLLPEEQIFPLRDTIIKAIEQGQGRNTLILGPSFTGKRDGIYHYIKKVSGGEPHPSGSAGNTGAFPPLIVRFGTGGINPLTSAWNDQIQALITEAAVEKQEIITDISLLYKFLFAERLREELSPFMIEKGSHYFSLLLDAYVKAALKKKAVPVLILENIHLAEKEAAQIIKDLFTDTKTSQKLLVLGACDAETEDTDLKYWETVFTRIIKLKTDNYSPAPVQMTPELWEITYYFSLLDRCFPSDLFPNLLEEEGKNKAVISRAFSLLSSLGVIDTPSDPRPRIKDFNTKAEAALKERKNLIRQMAAKRILFWVEQKKLNPCFSLLVLLAELSGRECLTDELFLNSMYADLSMGIYQQIEDSCNSGSFRNIANKEKAEIFKYIYKTMRTLLRGTEDEIKTAFIDPLPECSAFPVLKAQILANLSCYHLGQRDIRPALETIKEAIQVSQRQNNFCLSQSYRLFSLINLSRKQSNETNDYLDFAMENAKKNGNSHELGISGYYAAVSQFLFGNISKAIRLTQMANENSLAAGHPDWADRCRFLEGRLSFEIGNYREALEIFEDLWKKPAGGMNPEKDRLLASWVYRARVFFQNPLTQKPSNGGYDADLFEIEAAYLAGNFQKAVELSGNLTNLHIEQNFQFTEQPDWRSGFAQCELLYFSRLEIWNRMIYAYHSLSLCRISSGEEALYNMQRILRDEQLSEMDPMDPFYFYAWYRILEETGAGQVDINTAVSMAFKRLQRRASRIDEIETRRKFLFQPHWNSALNVAARELKLI